MMADIRYLLNSDRTQFRPITLFLYAF